MLKTMCMGETIDPQARYLVDQLNGETEMLHRRIERLNTEKSDLWQHISLLEKLSNETKEHESKMIRDHQIEIEEMKQNLDWKEYLMQYTEQRNTELEKILIKRSSSDEYIKKRLSGLGIEPKIGWSIKNVVEDLSEA